MAGPGDNAAPVIIKRKKVTKADGHHGGAWKVAYADFVTAMMAFFLLMWLLNATTENQRKGIADYFSPTIPINRVSAGGESSFGGDSVFTEERLARNGTGGSNRRPTEARQARGESGLSKDGGDSTPSGGDHASTIPETLEPVEEMILGRAGESTVSDALNKHVRTRVTDEGLIIELHDSVNAALFRENSADATLLLKDLSALVASAAALVENGIAVAGHTSARPVVALDSPVWDLSTARAHVVRRLLEGAGVKPRRLRRVSGHANRELAVRDPMSPRNNRIEIILLRSEP
ncbi:flagellar motor protein MotB [Roseovarius salis]|uniref:flagellar motor protein MotB n=1 Tax=Roseovarius salis TaxID=3376063 RepID=UPI0037C725D6